MTLKADDDYKLKQMQELLRGYMAGAYRYCISTL